MIRFGSLERDYMYSLFRGVIYSYNSLTRFEDCNMADMAAQFTWINKLQKNSASIGAAGGVFLKYYMPGSLKLF